MKVKHSAVVAVTMTPEMRSTLEEMAEARGETISLILRDLVRAATGGRRAPALRGSVAAPSTGGFR
jgi:hypothetical protein